MESMGNINGVESDEENLIGEEFEFNPLAVESELVGRIFGSVFDNARKRILKELYSFNERFYADIQWLSGEFEQLIGFSRLILCENLL
jgi:hypothetical protein